jgi:hypothetical protein
MGSFYTNVTLVGVDAAPVLEWLDAQGRQAYVAIVGPDLVVFDAAGESQDGSHAALASELSTIFGAKALAALNHDDDILFLQAFDRGTLVGEYNSQPDYFGEDGDEDGPGGSDPGSLDGATLVALFGAGEASTLQALLDEEAVFASDQHVAIVEHLGLPLAAAGFGYTYLSNGEHPDGVDADTLRQVGS